MPTPAQQTFASQLTQVLVRSGGVAAAAPREERGMGTRPLARDPVPAGADPHHQAVLDVVSAMRTILDGRAQIVVQPAPALRLLGQTLHDQLRREDGPRAAPLYAALASLFGDIGFLHDKLADGGSRDLLLALMAYRVLGSPRARLPLDTPDRVRAIRHCGSLRASGPPVELSWMDLALDPLDLRPLGFDMTLHATGEGVLCAFVQRQYEYATPAGTVRVEPGDTVIDAGVCWGDTLLYFAHQAGPSGRVLGFEFMPSHLTVTRHNLSRNPRHAATVELVEHAVWETSGETLHYVDWGPGSRLVGPQDKHDGSTTTLSIDDLVAQKGLDRVDFIKMDIEGAEAPALRGALATIRRFHPKLAISLYHSAADFVRVPQVIESAGLPYRYHLAHHTAGLNETVLFADPIRG